MKKVILSSVFTFCFAIIFASNGAENNVSTPIATQKIEGKIIDNETNEALAGVALKLQNSDKKFYTDLDGNFVIDVMPEDSYNIEVVYLSYKEVTLENISAKNNGVKLKVKLESVQH